MMKFKLEINFKDFEYGVINVMKEVDYASVKGMEEGMQEYMDDCLKQEPKVPRRSGSL
ncbi:unnamed protein product, partial [marine sediment metagenome]